MSTETNAEVRTRQAREHFEKYETLTQRIGLEKLIPLIPATPAAIAAALASGDEHLNTIPLSLWDRAIGLESMHKREKCSCCGQLKPWKNPDLRFQSPHRLFGRVSIAEAVCVLKHVARHHVAEAK